MGYFDVNGISIPVESLVVSDASKGSRGFGETGRRWRSEVGPTRIGVALTTPLLPEEEAYPTASLLSGEGEVWSDSDFGSKGTKSITALAAHDGSSHKFGTHYFDVTTAPDDFVNITNVDGLFLDDGWTVMMWYDDGGGYDHYGLCGDGLKFENGVINAGATLPFSVDSAGVLSLDSNGNYDDIVVLPFDMPEGWVTELDLTQAFPALPLLNLSGDFWDVDFSAEHVSVPTLEPSLESNPIRWRASIVLEEHPARPFILSPEDMSDVAAWYDAQDLSTLWQDSGRTTAVTADGQTVEAWDDKSGNARHATNATGTATYSAKGVNGLPAVDFPNLTTHSLVTAAFTLGTTGGLAAFMVMDLDTVGSVDYAVYHRAGGAVRVIFSIDSGTGVGPGFYDGAHKAFGAPAIAAGDEGVWSIVFEGGGNATLRKNGVALHASVAYTSFADASDVLTIGGGTAPMDGRMGELILLNREPTEPERTGLENYLRRRWRMP